VTVCIICGSETHPPSPPMEEDRRIEPHAYLAADRVVVQSAVNMAGIQQCADRAASANEAARRMRHEVNWSDPTNPRTRRFIAATMRYARFYYRTKTIKAAARIGEIVI